jgi:hypothetical protein
MDKNIQTIEVHNKISPLFQQISIDGAFGGITPQGKINLNFFSERLPIPKSSTFEISENKVIKKISDSPDSKKGIIREYSFGVYMNLETAKGIGLWLKEQVEKLESAQKEVANDSMPKSAK